MLDLIIAFTAGALLSAGLICSVLLVVKDDKIEIVDDDDKKT